MKGIDKLHDKCMMKMILSDPVIPIKWGAEQKGMQTGSEVDPESARKAIGIWLDARDLMIKAADALAELGVHKSLCNRLTEPFMWITVLVTATEWKNFFRLRIHPDAEIHFQKIAGMILDEIEKSTPKLIDDGDWHCPFLDESEQLDRREACLRNNFAVLDRLKRISVGRCARVSYLTHEGKRDPQEDVNLTTKLIERTDNVIHASPLEHVAQALDNGSVRSGPFVGWKQFRKDFPNENVEG